MNVPRQEQETRLIEMVETHVLTRSLIRLNQAPSYDSARWKRAFYHALLLSGVTNYDMAGKIRVAMELP